MQALQPSLSYTSTRDLPHVPFFTDRFRADEIDLTPSGDSGVSINHSAIEQKSTHFVDNSSQKTLFDRTESAPAGSSIAAQAQQLLADAQQAQISTLSEGHTSIGPGFNWGSQGGQYASTWAQVPANVQQLFTAARALRDALPG
jgi:hypothetical protein